MNASRARTAFAQIGVTVAAVAVSALMGGCGNNYRPVVTPAGTNGPAPQPSSFAVVVSTTSSSTDGVVTIIDYSGDTIMTEATIGPGPTAFTLDELGATGYTINSDGTLSNFAITTSLQTKNVLSSTLPPTAQPVNLMPPSSGLWATDLNGNVVDQFTGSPEAFLRAIPVTGTVTNPNTLPMFIAGSPTVSGGREYVISQDVPDTAPMTCNQTPRTVSTDGAATPIELSSNTADPAIPAGKCPVYAVPSADQQRLYVLNRGDDTLTVINIRNNTLDTGCPPPAGCTNQNGQTYFTHATQQLVVANYDGGSISVIDVSLDEYGNDSATFGTTYTIPVGNTATPNPASVTVLYDGSKAYTANQNDGTANGTVPVVNLSTHTVEKTLTVVGHPRTVMSTQNSEYSKVYTASPDSPYITIIESSPTVTDVIDTTVLVEGLPIDIRTTTQSGSGGGNNNYSSRVPGYGQPCNLPGSASLASLAACQAIP